MSAFLGAIAFSEYYFNLMGMTNLTLNGLIPRNPLYYILPFCCIIFSTDLRAQCDPACYDLVRVSIDASPQVISPEVLLALPASCLGAFTISLKEKDGTAIGDSINCNHVGKMLTATLTNTLTGNSCWGKILVEDKVPPVLVCNFTPLAITCLDTIPAAFPNPAHTSAPRAVATDNCGAPTTIRLISETTTQVGGATAACEDDSTRIVRIYQAYDRFGNTNELSTPGNPLGSRCTTIIRISRPWIVQSGAITGQLNICSLVPHKTFFCSIRGLADSISAAVSGRELLKFNRVLCGYQVTWVDQTLTDPFCPAARKILRNWTAICWCTGAVLTCQQIIKVIDVTPPTITRGPYEISANITGSHPSLCSGTGPFRAAVVFDSCSTWTYKIFTSQGEVAIGGHLPAPGLPLGAHNVIYIATDACGNQRSDTVVVTVVDNITPTAVCQEFTVASLNSLGTATVFAAAFDVGSYDNCCLDKILVKKVEQTDAFFGPSVSYTCTDLPGPYKVILRAYDCNSPALLKDCLVELKLQDRNKPTIVCTNLEITCDDYSSKLYEQLRGKPGLAAATVVTTAYPGLLPAVADNCTPTRTFVSFRDSIDKCNTGKIWIVWKAVDQSGNESPVCTSAITINYRGDIVWHASNRKDSSDIVFPPNITVNCGTTRPDFGSVWINPAKETCELIAINYSDKVYTVVPDACYKVIRTWKVVDWCLLSAGSIASDSIIATYDQTIKVLDNVAPVFANGCAIDSILITNLECTASVTLPKPVILECSANPTLSVTSALGIGFGPFNNVKPGNYTINYLANDNCNNHTTCSTTLRVIDKKPPVAYCKTSLVIVLDEQGKATIKAKDFDAGSFDNCSNYLIFSFSADTSEKTLLLDCIHIGATNINMWVTDEAGNKDYCSAFIFVQQNASTSCPRPRLVVTGKVSNEKLEAIEGVSVQLNGNTSSYKTTGVDGAFEFVDVNAGGDYSITPSKDKNPLNGVTTFDLVLISRHILGVQNLDSPYKIIAADANRSNSVTTLDLVELRRLILFVNAEFSSNTSWRFVDRNYSFPNPLNPFDTPFPELQSFNNVTTSQLKADFVGVKVGDVNGSAIVNSLISLEDRNTVGALELATNDFLVKKGESYTVDFSAEKMRAIGMQFTMSFDPKSVEIVEIMPGLLGKENFGTSKMNSGAVTASWHNLSGPVSSGAQDVFGLRFKALVNGRLSDLLAIDSKYTKAEAYTSQLELLSVNLMFTKGADLVDFALYQNTPNPFNEFTTIGFQLPAGGFAKFSFSDVSGRLVKSIEGEFSKGYNELRVRKSDLGTGGVLFYKLETSNFTAIQKMLVLD